MLGAAKIFNEVSRSIIKDKIFIFVLSIMFEGRNIDPVELILIKN